MAQTETKVEDQDRQLEQRVSNFLKLQQVPGARRVRIDALAGVITISGTVPSYYYRQLCASACNRVAGVHRIIDNLRVEYGLGGPTRAAVA